MKIKQVKIVFLKIIINLFAYLVFLPFTITVAILGGWLDFILSECIYFDSNFLAKYKWNKK